MYNTQLLIKVTVTHLNKTAICDTNSFVGKYFQSFTLNFQPKQVGLHRLCNSYFAKLTEDTSNFRYCLLD